MRELRIFSLLLALSFLISALVFRQWYNSHEEKHSNECNVAINRINAEICSSDTYPDAVIAEKSDEWKRAFGTACPDVIEYMPITSDEHEVFTAGYEGDSVVCAVYHGDELSGLMRYSFIVDNDKSVTVFAVTLIGINFLLTAALFLHIYIKIIKPFNRLSDYPERLARMQTTGRLPESKSRYFGKYIWGMNMLADRLENDRKHIRDLEYQRQTLLASIAHGVKTPVANIRLYASAIMTGLYSDVSSDTEIAARIDSNAEKISNMVAELLETSATSLVDYEPVIKPFRLAELRELIEREFADRFTISRVPFTLNCDDKLKVCSDKWGLYRVLSQLLENALKYGDGTGITVDMQKQDDGLCFTVRDKGELLPEKELPYIFKSYWRGSNAAAKEGSGIGLYVCHEIVKLLGGSIQARRLEESGEMEFIIYFDE